MENNALYAEIDRLKKNNIEMIAALRITEDNIKTIAAAHKCEIYTPWLQVVRNALSKANDDLREGRGGFHFFQNPLDVFSYYPPGTSRYACVKGMGNFDKHNNSDSKIACTHIKAESKQDKNGSWQIKGIKTVKVDGKKIKANIFYKLKNGKFVEVK